MLKMQWKESESLERPMEVDETSSAFVVYLRKDIVETEVPATDNNPATVKYVYKEAVLSKEEYELYKMAKEAAAAAVALLQGV